MVYELIGHNWVQNTPIFIPKRFATDRESILSFKTVPEVEISIFFGFDTLSIQKYAIPNMHLLVRYG